ncbi:MAG: peptidylprolyl isomerase [Christensenellales bacterium]|jgi:foldase protein PrsA
MKRIVKAFVCILCIMLAMALAGCELVSVNSERDLNQTVAIVDGKTITKRKVNYMFENLIGYSGMSLDSSDPFVQLQLQMQRIQLVGDMVNELVGYNKAAELGYEAKLTEEDIEEIETGYNEFIEYYEVTLKEAMIKTYAEWDDAEAKAEQEVKALLDQYLLDSNFTSPEEYKETLKLSKMREKLNEDIKNEVVLDEAKVQSAYEEQLEMQKEYYSEDAAAYASAESSGSVMLYNAPGLRRVKNLLIEISEDDSDAIIELRMAGDDEGADKLLEAALEKIRPQAEEALQRARDGEDFDALLDELGADAGMEPDTEGREKGYLVYAENQDYVAAFTEASMELDKEGDISDLVATDYGYHILLYFKEIKEGVVPYEDIKEAFEEYQLTTEQSMALEKKYSEWYAELEEAGKLRLYMDRVEDVKLFGQG